MATGLAYARPLAAGFAILLLLAAAREPVAAMCIVEATSFDFGRVALGEFPPYPEIATISYRCMARMPMGIKLKLLRGQSVSPPLHVMENPTEKHPTEAQLEYEVTLDPAGHQPWGDGTYGTQVYYDPHPPLNQTVEFKAYAHIVGSRGPLVPGRYVDRLVVDTEF